MDTNALDILPEGGRTSRGTAGARGSCGTRIRHPIKQPHQAAPESGRPGSSCAPIKLPPHQYTLTPYALSASTTGWKNVVPPEEQLPLPPEVRPTARVPE